MGPLLRGPTCPGARPRPGRPSLGEACAPGLYGSDKEQGQERSAKSKCPRFQGNPAPPGYWLMRSADARCRRGRPKYWPLTKVSTSVRRPLVRSGRHVLGALRISRPAPMHRGPPGLICNTSCRQDGCRVAVGLRTD
jgi:hypothetical protein